MARRSASPPSALIVAALLVSTAHGQILQDHKPLRSGVEVTIVTATVLDREGHLATDLPRDVFQIYEDGELQTLTQFTHERVPIGLGMLVDVSDSMYGRRIRDARAAVERFLLDLLQPSDEVFVLAFNHEPRLLTNWTSTPEVVRQALDGLRPSGGTAIYDAVLKALPIIDARSRERAALVLISDGADTASDASLRDVRSALLRSDAFVYAVAIDSPEPQPINTRVNSAALSDLTDQSGGHTDVVRDAADLAAATARIAQELNSQYVLGYSSPKGADGQYHSIRVRVTEPGYRVRARNGYVAGTRKLKD